MANDQYPPNYLIYNNQVTKLINIVVSIDGAPTAISLVQPFKKIHYGDPGLFYGGAGLYYGGLIEVGTDAVQSLISLESSLTVNQQTEPEQGKASVSTITLVVIDKNQYITKLMSPGVILDEPLGNKLVTIKLGFLNTSYPEDYFTVFRGYITSIKSQAGKYFLQISDATTKQRSQVFFTGTTTLTGDINNSVTSIPVAGTQDFIDPILGPLGTYDASVIPYIVIDNEIMQYSHSDLAPTSITVTARGARGTTAASHTNTTAVANTCQLKGNGIDLALKVMLSGWNGPFISGVLVQAIQDTGMGLVANALVFPDSVDLVDIYGLTINDQVIVSGSGAGNNGNYFIAAITSYGFGTNNGLLMSTNFPSVENPATTVNVAFRSQYDTLPTTFGLKMSPREVDVAQYQLLRTQFFSQSQFTLQFYIKDRTAGKAWIESEIMLPFAAYDITRFGRLSMTTAKPPIAGTNLRTLDKTNVLEPHNIAVERAINNRGYFNDIQYRWDLSDDGQTFAQVLAILDPDSISKVAVDLQLPIQSAGLRSTLGAVSMIQSRSRFLITRYRSGVIVITLKCNWMVGSLIETGDIVLLNDNGGLQIANWQTGVRDMGSQLWEVTQRSLDIKSGQVQLRLMSQIGYQQTDRFATISPSSIVVGASSTVSRIKIKDSFGALFPGNEQAKWTQLIGSAIQVHSYNYTTYNQSTTLTGFDPADPYTMLVSPALSSSPPDGAIVDIAFYPNDTNPLDQQIQKLLFDHLSPTVAVVSGINSTSFTVSSGDAAKFTVGLPVIVHNASYSVKSPECVVLSIVGTTITVSSSLGFTPTSADFVDGIGFIDGGGFYRVL